MAKTLDPKAIEAERQTSSRAERREQKRRQMQDEISYNQRGNGVIVIPPQKRREVAEEPPKLRVAAYCRVSTQEEQQVGSFDMQIHHFTKRIEANPQWELVEIYQDESVIIGLKPHSTNGRRFSPIFYLPCMSRNKTRICHF